MSDWDLSCTDWETRIRRRESLMPSLPLFQDEAADAVALFNAIRLPDVPGTPLLADAAGPWFSEIVAALFGARDPATNNRHFRELFALVPKGQSKTTYTAALMIVALLMNVRPRGVFIFVGPTQAISDRALSQAMGMIDLDPELRKRFHPKPHVKEILDRKTRATLKVKTFDLNILTGEIPAGVVVDELHLLGRHHATARVLRQLRGGIEKTSEGFLVMITTQSDEPPAGAFKEELLMARSIRDGRVKGRMLPILYEFPEAIARDKARWQDPANWPLVMPNLGRSMHIDSLIADWSTERQKGEAQMRVWASQHLNIEIGVGLKTDRWRGAEHWEQAIDPTLTFETLLERSELVCVGIDGGGLDDLFGLAVLGRERETKRWLLWTHAWCHRGVLTVRPSIASRLLDFEKAGELTIVDDKLDDLTEIVGIVAQVNEAGILGAVGVDPEGIGALVDEMAAIDVTEDNKKLWGVMQGIRLMNSIKTAERKLVSGMLVHTGGAMMAWCVGNLKIEPTATAIRATKMNAGDLKIDPVMAVFDAVAVLQTIPDTPGSIYDDEDAYIAAFKSGPAISDDDAWSPEVLADMAHPQFSEHKRRFEAWQDRQPEDVI